MRQNVMIRAAGVLVLGVLAAGMGACSQNQTTGRNQLVSLSRDQEVSVGATEGPKLTQEFGGEVQNPLLRAYVDEVGQKLKNQTEGDGPTRTWKFTLLDSDVINAFALPGEQVFMSRGLADKFTSEAQLAGVLGHEIGHVMARHTSERLAQSQYVGVGAAILGAVLGSTVKSGSAAQALPQLVGAGGQVIVLNFSREQESEADSLGMRYMAKAGYNPRGQLQVMQVLKAASGSGGGPEWLATHPAPATRIERVTQELNTTYAYTQTGAQAGSYQEYPDRYQQRYLSIRALEPKPLAKPKKASVDERGRTRLLAAVDWADPMSWCSLCQEGTRRGHHVAVEP